MFTGFLIFVGLAITFFMIMSKGGSSLPSRKGREVYLKNGITC